MNSKRLLTALLFVVMSAGFMKPALADDAAPVDLQSQIKDRSARLDQLNKEIQDTQSTLNQVQRQKSSLQNQLKTLDTSIKQLDLSIQADNLKTQDLGTQIGSLQEELDAMNRAIDDKRTTVTKLFREMQKADDRNMVSILLSNDSLSGVLQDAESVENMRSQLALDIDKLNQMTNQYQTKLGEVTEKKSEVTLHLENQKNRKLIIQDQKVQRQVVLSETKSQENVYQDKLSKLQAEQNALEDEITQMENQLGQNFNNNVLPAKRHGLLAWPLADVRITQHFGERSKLYRGKPHNGVDFAASIGTPIFAAADGVVWAVDNNDRSSWSKYQYGKYVLIKHPNGFATIYGHMSRQVAVAGQQVKKGDLIGYSGSTGYATGPHLHFGLYWAATVTLKSLPPAAGLVPVGVVLNPEDYL